MKKVFFTLSILFLLQTFLSCGKKYSQSELKTNFTTEQIADLTEIRTFFIKQVCESDFKSCFEKTNHDSLLTMGSGIWAKVNFNQQTKLYKKISKSTFNEIWTFCESTFYPSEIKAKSLCPMTTGKYQRYLSDIGKANPRIAKYAKKMEATGAFHGLDIQYQEIFNDPNSFDLNDPNIQLILAIHYLSINDQVTRNKDLVELPIDLKSE